MPTEVQPYVRAIIGEGSSLFNSAYLPEGLDDWGNGTVLSENWLGTLENFKGTSGYWLLVDMTTLAEDIAAGALGEEQQGENETIIFSYDFTSALNGNLLRKNNAKVAVYL